jgi:hypothetical protein
MLQKLPKTDLFDRQDIGKTHIAIAKQYKKTLLLEKIQLWIFCKFYFLLLPEYIFTANKIPPIANHTIPPIGP